MSLHNYSVELNDEEYKMLEKLQEKFGFRKKSDTFRRILRERYEHEIQKFKS